MVESKGRGKQQARVKGKAFLADSDRAVVAVWSATRRDHDLSQSEVAEKLGWSRDTVASVESGRKRPTFSELRLFATVLGVPAETLFRRILEW